jgi:peptide/nickel transport system substrate-binding protein
VKVRRITLAAVSAAVLAVGLVHPLGTLPASASTVSATIPLLTAGTTSGYSTLNPNDTQGCVIEFCGLIYEHLVKFGPNGSLEPELATSVSTPDPTTYVYHLRHGVHFWDGNEMTSADVVASINYQRTPSSQTEVFLANVKSVTAPDRYTVVVTLKQPDQSWKYIPAYEAVIFEKKFLDEHRATFGNPGVLIEATGPWEIDSFDPTTGADLSANPHWWGGEVPIQHITFKVFSTETSAALAMRAGQIDVFFPAAPQAFASTSGVPVITSSNAGAGISVGYFGMNTKLAPWDDVHVRRAVAYALNRADIIKVLGGYAMPVSTVIPPAQLRTIGSQMAVNTLLKSLPSYPFNLTMAKAEMAKSAYPNGFSATLDEPNYSNFPDICQVIAAELAKIGINLTITLMPTAKWSALVYGPKTFGPMFTTIGGQSPDPGGIPGYLLGSKNVASGLNFASYTPPVLDKLLAEGLATSNTAKRLDIYGQIVRSVATDVPYVPLYLTTSEVALSSKFTWPGFDEVAFDNEWALKIKPAA